ncbi:outer membrane protein assembly factor BamB family protein [Bacillus sp. JJ1562]|uniref:outer membrane protein assembly factor BamB family protein n=1 Tax=Bacillus sp. JJ1562 TaxID=3122960 RepID=UPI00300352DD
MGRKLRFGTAIIASIMLLLAACQSQPEEKEPEKEKEPPKIEEKVEEKEVNGDYPSFGYDLGLTRHVPYDEITKENVKEVGLVWSKKFKEINPDIPNGNQNYPVVIEGVAYVSTSMNFVYAFDAITGDVIWEWIPPQEIIENAKRTGMINTNRGVAVADGKVFMITNNVGLVSIDQNTGETVKYVKISEYFPDLTPENGYYETTAPTYFDGKIFVGSSGGDNGVRGFEMAFNASDLTPAWDEPFWTVPPKGEDWLADGLFGGGGAVWMLPSVDEETGTLYFSAGNPAPDFYGESRPGANPHTNSVLAVDADTGKLKWAQQQISHDLWDYDTADSPTVYTATINGEKRRVVAVGTKGGEWFVYDAKSGEPIYKNVPFAKIDHPAPTPEGTLVYPGILGGQNYAPNTYDPVLNFDLIPSIEQGAIIKTAKNEEEAGQNTGGGRGGAQAFGTSYAPPADEDAYGTITAFDLNTGKQVWQIETPDAQRGGLTSTATGITFYGELDGKVNALDTETGEILWTYQTTGKTISAAPSIFVVDGKQYIMITSAGSDPQVFVFALGGEQNQAESGESEEAEDPHAAHESEEKEEPNTNTSEPATTEANGNVIEINLTAKNFEFDPQEIQAKVGDTIRFTMSNDSGLHGIALDEFGMNLKEGETFEFVVTKAGEFQYYCSIPCGPGHDNMTGTLIVT